MTWIYQHRPLRKPPSITYFRSFQIYFSGHYTMSRPSLKHGQEVVHKSYDIGQPSAAIVNIAENGPEASCKKASISTSDDGENTPPVQDEGFLPDVFEAQSDHPQENSTFHGMDLWDDVSDDPQEFAFKMSEGSVDASLCYNVQEH
eukprot:TRINITY_DN4627_c0_g1_i2.p1 TRINITY_DN4627_c0_g1~~TRINITY_DN4627_c0_g1_i2.p1  ORF type:complete len:146 (+),score=19.68 TRINITY_DN4627_c0_g1_i2:525-962(+)